MENTINLSIVTSYYNRRNLLLKTLESVNSSDFCKFIEFVIVDDGSDEDERLEDIVNNYNFPINLLRVEPKDKWYVNPCVPFNKAFKAAKADNIIIQNPECYHVGDIIKHALANISDDKYIAYAAYALNAKDTQELGSRQLKVESIASNGNQQEGWYNHSTINPRPLHFASCISKKNLDELGGFDEAYAEGIAFDDDELLMRIRDKGLTVEICDDPFVLHQSHYDENAYENRFKASPELLHRNQELYLTEYRKRHNPKIIGFSQLHNELELGNLENWFKCMEVCDEIYIFDQASTDGSKEYYKKFDNVHVIESETNRFQEELLCKQELLDKLLDEHPDADWIIWIDGDTLLDGRLLERPDPNSNRTTLHEVLFNLDLNRIESAFMGHYNLWRSDVWHRVDDQYDHFMQAGRMVLWKNTGNLKFNIEPGLHKSQHPVGIRNTIRLPFNLIHRGFATDEQLLKKYENYKSRGQSGWALDRFLEESTLKVERVPENEFPSWLPNLDDQNPLEKEKIKTIYDSRKL